MAIIPNLMGVGFSSAQAGAVGLTPSATVAGAGTAQKTDSAAITASNLLALGLNIVTTAGGQTAVQIPSTMPVGGEMWINNTSATAALLFPPSGGTINGGSADASFSVAQNKPVHVIRWTTVIFTACLSA
jgi:hypothetical protein